MVGVACLALVGAAGCGRDLRCFDQVQQGFDQPTGTVSASTAPTIFSAGSSPKSSSAASLASTFDTTGTLDLGSPRWARPPAPSRWYRAATAT